MKPQYILTVEEYNELKDTKPNEFLKQRVEDLEVELEKYSIYKRSMELESDRLAEVVTEDTIQVEEVKVDTITQRIMYHYDKLHKTIKGKIELYNAIDQAICDENKLGRTIIRKTIKDNI